MVTNAHIPVVGLAAFSGTGKTTLLRALLPLLEARGVRVGVVKHAHHTFEVDQPGKDSYELRMAGARQVLISSRRRWALMVERALGDEPTLDQALLDIDQGGLDLVVVEGFKRERFPKIEVRRAAFGGAFLCETDPDIIAIATDSDGESQPGGRARLLPLLPLNRPEEIADFIVERIVVKRPLPVP